MQFRGEKKRLLSTLENRLQASLYPPYISPFAPYLPISPYISRRSRTACRPPPQLLTLTLTLTLTLANLLQASATRSKKAGRGN